MAPEFDSGMNAGTGQDEVQRLGNFGQGAEENPTVAQSQPITRAVQQTAVVGPGGEPLFVPGPTEANVGNSMGVGGYMGNQMIKENAGILAFFGLLPPGAGGGGMGVVYRARQISLNRPVALKMILAGQLANDMDIKRFRLEAEAAAGLTTRGSCRSTRSGEHLELSYFCLEFVEGGSLDHKVAAGPLPSPRQPGWWASWPRRSSTLTTACHPPGPQAGQRVADENGRPGSPTSAWPRKSGPTQT